MRFPCFSPLFGLLAGLLLPLLPARAGDPALDQLQKAVVAELGVFERVEWAADGTATAFEVELGGDAMTWQGDVYDGFRLRAPEEMTGRDFVWFFNAPENWSSWYIVPVVGPADAAFRSWQAADRVYEALDRPGETGRSRILQSLEGTYFTPGEEYVIWFRRAGGDGRAKLRGKAGFARAADAWDLEEIERALALKPAPAEAQVTALSSRGGAILLDQRFFDRDYAEGRIDSALMGIRRTQGTGGGFFVTIQTSVPPCTTTPSLAEIEKAHGPADFVRSPAERARLLGPDADAEDGDDDEGLVAHHYDYFAFEVEAGAEDPKVVRVTTFASDFSEVAPVAKGAGFASIGIENLTVFSRAGKEVGRAYFFLEGGKEPHFVTRPPEGEYRHEGERLTCGKDGSWTWESRRGDGTLARRILLERDRFHGKAEGFHPNGRPRFTAEYREGELHGEVVEFDETGTEVSRRRFERGEPVED